MTKKEIQEKLTKAGINLNNVKIISGDALKIVVLNKNEEYDPTASRKLANQIVKILIKNKL